jgi:osmoprotectant transport system permease protein
MNDFATALLTHLEMSFLGVLMGCVVGVFLATLLKNRASAAKAVFAFIDIIQTVPTLAMLIFLMLIFGLNNTTVILAIFLYSLFPITRNTYVGLANVPGGVLRAGQGLGMTNLQLYLMVELPIALPVIFSGLRLAIIAALGIATTGVFIGAGGLGMLIWRGIQTRNTMMLLSGAIPVSAMAILFEFLFTYMEKRLTNRTKERRSVK